MANHDLTTPEPRETRYIRATTPVAVELHQPVAPGQVRAITGRVFGEMRVNGCVHHYRVEDGDGVLFLVPPEWIELLPISRKKSEPVRAKVDAPVATRTLESAG